MSYLEKVLRPDERVIHRTGLHWLVYWRAVLATAIAGVIWAVSRSFDQGVGWVLALVSGAVLLYAFLSAARAWLVQYGTEIAVTNRRIIVKAGLIQRETTEMDIDKVESVDVSQSILGRIFDFGTITVRGTGSSVEPIRNVTDPIALRSAILAP